MFGVRSLRFERPAPCVERIGTKSLTLLQRIVADDGTVRSQRRSVMVAFEFAAQQRVPVPDAWRRALEAE